MSADEYQACPLCGGVPEQYRKLKNQYGKIPLEEFLHFKKLAESKTNYESVAVYQEITLNADHTLDIQVSAECRECNAGWLYNVKGVNGGKK